MAKFWNNRSNLTSKSRVWLCVCSCVGGTCIQNYPVRMLSYPMEYGACLQHIWRRSEKTLSNINEYWIMEKWISTRKKSTLDFETNIQSLIFYRTLKISSELNLPYCCLLRHQHLMYLLNPMYPIQLHFGIHPLLPKRLMFIETMSLPQNDPANKWIIDYIHKCLYAYRFFFSRSDTIGNVCHCSSICSTTQIIA